MADYGKGVRITQTRSGKTNRDMEKRWEVSAQTIQNWRNGKGLKIELVEEITAFCESSMDQFLKDCE